MFFTLSATEILIFALPGFAVVGDEFWELAGDGAFGAEGFARKYDLPVLYYEVVKERIGRYRIDVKLITEHPNELPEGAVMQRYAEYLEDTIRKRPEYWLWSHRRWKNKFD